MEVNILFIVLLAVGAFLGGFGSRLLRVPPVVGYIVAGVFLGLIGKNYFYSPENLYFLSEIGISLLLFTLGVEFSLDKLRSIKSGTLVVGVFQVLLIAVVLFPVLILFRIDLPVAVFFAVALVFSSGAVVVKKLEEKGIINSFPGRDAFLFVLIQSLFIVPVIFLMPVIFGGNIGFAGIFEFVISVLGVGVVFIAVVFANKILLSKALNSFFSYPTHELVLLVTIFSVFLSIGLFAQIGMSFAIAAFLAGVVIPEQSKNLSPLSGTRTLRDILLLLFFVLGGMMLDVSVVVDVLPLIVFLSILVLGVKFLSIFLVLRSSSYLLFPAVFVASHLSHVGEFTVVLGLVAFTRGYIDATSFNVLLSVFVILMVVLPFLLKYIHLAFEYLVERGWMSDKGRRELLSHKVSMETEELRDHVIVCGHGRVGSEVRHLLNDAGISYVVVDNDRKIYNELAELNKPVILGDPTDPEVLKAGGIEKAKVVVLAAVDDESQKKIIKSTLSQNPKITIVCRTDSDKHRYDLLNLGANTIVIPEFEAGVRIGHSVMDVYNIGREEIISHIKKLRKQHFID